MYEMADQMKSGCIVSSFHFEKQAEAILSQETGIAPADARFHDRCLAISFWQQLLFAVQSFAPSCCT
jgi:hypothetical protein